MQPTRRDEESRGAAGARGGDGTVQAACAWAYFHGEIVPFESATVSIATHSFNYGTAVFEGIRAYRTEDGKLGVLKLREHYERLFRSARLLKAAPAESLEELSAVTLEILRRHGRAEDIYVRPILYKASHSIRLQLAGLEDRVAIYAFPMGGYLSTDALHVTISSWRRVDDNAIPSRGKLVGSYVNTCLAADDARAGGFQEAILLTSDGHVAEASSANLFVVRDGEIATPPLSDDILPGITREAVMELAKDAGRPVVERRIDRSELYLADEIFFTGTGVQVACVASLDGRPVGDGSAPVTHELQQQYFDAVRGRSSRYSHWLTLVDP